MYQLEHSSLLWALTLIPAFWGVFFMVRAWRRRVLKRFGDLDVVKPLANDFANWKPVFKLLIYSAATFFLVFAMVNPQIGTRMEEVKREGVDLMVALDVSTSMVAEDLSPNRLERSKRAIAKLIDRLHADRLGIVVFAGEAYVQLPITTDYAAAKLFLNTIDTDMMPTQGTAIGTAIELAAESFDPESPTSKAIIVISDGDNHEDDAVYAAGQAAEHDIVIHTVGVGSTDGTPIPVYRNGKQIGHKQDANGHTVVTRLNEAMLKEIANAGNGSYVHASNAQSGLDLIMDEIDQLEKVEYDAKVFTDYEDRFQWFLIVAIFLFGLEMLIPVRKWHFLRQLNLFG